MNLDELLRFKDVDAVASERFRAHQCNVEEKWRRRYKTQEKHREALAAAAASEAEKYVFSNSELELRTDFFNF